MKTKMNALIGENYRSNRKDFSEQICFSDHKIRFLTKYCAGKDVLDIGCVQHNPENYKSKYWVHNALKAVSQSLAGLDLYEPGVSYLNKLGYQIKVADAQQFDLGKKFDVIVAGDLIEHLEDFHGFLESCKKHMHPNSRLLISTPNPWYWKNSLKAAFRQEVSNNPEHTCWLCVRTLRQLLARHNLKIGEVVFGSRYLRDRLMPLPSGWKHTSFHAEIYEAYA